MTAATPVRRPAVRGGAKGRTVLAVFTLLFALSGAVGLLAAHVA